MRDEEACACTDGVSHWGVNRSRRRLTLSGSLGSVIVVESTIRKLCPNSVPPPSGRQDCRGSPFFFKGFRKPQAL